MGDIFDLEGKVALVTGGSGSIGSTIAVALAKSGADVAIAARTPGKLEPITAEIKKLGRKGMAVSADVTDEQSVSAMVDKVVSEFSRIDILVNSAGAAIRKSAEEISIKEWMQIIEFNAKGLFICCQAVGKVMIKQNGGKIVNISSIRGRFGTSAGGVAYGPSKGAVDALTRTLACEWGKYHININAIAPTLVLTELTRPLFADAARMKKTVSQIPLGRMAELEDLVGPVLLLSSKLSDFMTGQIVYIDGGMSAGFM